MSRRRRERELAIQLMYALDLTGDEFEDARFRFLQAEPARRQKWGEFAERLVSTAHARREEIDALLRGALQRWRLERLLAIDRGTLRLACAELMFFPDIPSRVTLNEYVELARLFGDNDSPAFVNGVLDALARRFPDKDFQRTAADSEPGPQ